MMERDDTTISPEERALLEEGREAYRRQDWQGAISAFSQALRLNPDSEAEQWLQMTRAIVEFHDKEIYNP